MSDEKISAMPTVAVPPANTPVVPVVVTGVAINYKSPITTLLTGAPGINGTKPGDSIQIVGGDDSPSDAQGAGSVTIETGSGLTGNVKGGDLNITLGDGFGNQAGGGLEFVAGDGGATGDGGRVAIASGRGANGGDIDLVAQTAFDVNGGNVSIASGYGAGAVGTGGRIGIIAGDGSGSGHGGDIEIESGAANQSGGTARGGNIAIQTQTGGNTSGNGGQILLETGAGQFGTGDGGLIQISTGNANGTGGGGLFAIDCGHALSSGNGGSIQMRAGTSSPTGNGGTVSFAGGRAGTGNGGSIGLTTGAATVGTGGDFILTFGTGSVRNGLIIANNIPTSDPSVSHAVWNNGGFLVFSGTPSGSPSPSFQTIAATGSIQSNAATITAQEVIATTVAASTGVRLKLSPTAGDFQKILNRGTATLTVYPASAAQIESAGTNVGVPIVVGGDATFIAQTASQWVAA